MGEHDKTPIYYGVMMARGERDQCIGYQAYRMVRGESKAKGERTFVGPVRPTYAEAREDTWKEQECT